MAMNFPDAPTSGDIYGPYQWDGEKWVTIGTGDGGEGGGGLDQATADLRYVNIAGDAMAGFLALHADPTDPLHAVTKQYADALSGGGGGGAYLPLSGGTLTGKLNLPENIPDDYMPSLAFGPERNTGLIFAAVDDIPAYQGLMVMLDGQLKASFFTNGPTSFYGQLQLPRDAITAPPYTFSAMYGSGLYGSEPVEGEEIIGISIKTVSRFAVSETGITTTVPVTLPADPTAALHAATKAYVDSVAGGGGGATGDYLPLAGGTLTGALVISTSYASLYLDKNGIDQSAVLIGMHENNYRWTMHLGDEAPDSSDSGSNFRLERHTANGAATVLTFDRASGLGTVAGDPTALLGVATKQYVDALAMAGGSFVDAPSDGQQYARQDANWAVVAGGGGGGDYLPLTGGTLTGDLSAPGYLLGLNKFAMVDTAANRVTVWGTNTVKETLRLGVSANEYFADSHSFKGSDGMSTIFIASKTSGVAYYKPVSLQADPQQPLHAATKQYVDAQVAAGGGGATGDYLPLSGGEITGDLAISKIDPVLVLERPDTLSSAQIISKVSGVDYWTMTLGIIGDNDFSLYRSFSGSTNPAFSIEHDTGIFNIYSRLEARADINTPNLTVMFDATLGRDPTLPLHAATKQYVDAVAGGGGGGEGGAYLPLIGGTLTGDLTIATASPTLTLDRADHSTNNMIEAKRGGVPEWRVVLGDNINYDFYIEKFDSDGVSGGKVFHIESAAGWVTLTTVLQAQAGIQATNLSVSEGVWLARDPTQPLEAATKQYVDLVASGGGGGAYLPITGGTVTGNLRVEAPSGSPAAYLIATQAQIQNRLQITGAADESAGGYLELGKWANGLVARVYGSYQGEPVWDITLGNESPMGLPEENWKGNDFEIASYDNFGRNRDINFKIDRYTGKATVHSDPVEPLGIATKNYVDARFGMIHVDDVMPTNVQEHVLWWDTVEGQLYIRMVDADYSVQWVQAVPDPYYMLKTTGGSMTGPMLLAADPTQPLEAATKQYVDGALSPLADLEARIRKLEQA